MAVSEAELILSSAHQPSESASFFDNPTRYEQAISGRGIEFLTHATALHLRPLAPLSLSLISFHPLPPSTQCCMRAPIPSRSLPSTRSLPTRSFRSTLSIPLNTPLQVHMDSTRQAMVFSLSKVQVAAAESFVPWFTTQMPVSYFRQVTERTLLPWR